MCDRILGRLGPVHFDRLTLGDIAVSYTHLTLGTESRTDVAIAYLADQVNEELLEALKQKLSRLQITSLTMGSKSLEELLIHKR